MRIDRRTATSTAAIAIVLALIAAISALDSYHARELRDAAREVDHTHEVIESLQAIVAAVNAAEGGQRGYLITGDPLYLEPFLAARTEAGTWIERVADLTRDNPAQQERIVAVRHRAMSQIGILQEAIDALSRNQRDIAFDVVRSHRGRAEMDTLRREVEEMVRVERQLLAEREARTGRIYRRARALNFAATALGLLAVLFVGLRLRRHLEERERSAARIQAEAARFQVTLASIGDAVITTDSRGCVTFLNPEAERLTGWSSSEAGGFPLEQVFRIVREETGEPLESPAARALGDGAVVGLAKHTVLVSRAGERHPVDDSAAPIRDAGGAVSGVVLVFRDVTESRRTENDLRRLAKELADADRRKNEFLAILAHELRNPLAPIRNSLKILERDGARDENAARALWALDRQSGHLARLVEDLLDVSRIGSGKIELRRSRVDLRDVLNDAVEASKAICTEAGQALFPDLPAVPLWVDGDVTRLTQSIGNLIHNACKYSDPGHEVRVSLYRDGDFAVIAVRDQGIGIERDQIGRIFDLFAQVDTSLDRTRGGLGIGLTLVRQFVELHGGTVEARSDGRGKGSEFRIRLPLVEAPAAVAKAAHPRDEMEAARKVKILVVDDNSDSAETLATLLRLLGHDCRTAGDGEEALTVAAELQPDVVLLDLGLPKLDGFQVAERLRATPARSSLRLVALTGWGQPEDRRRSGEAGFDAHLVKPVDHDELTALLAEISRTLN